jgi:formate hydrogenlyase subunit 6/NADH:ubiquinone oxidoreductase subunit I
VSGHGPSVLGEACVGCGRCAAACPTEAIAVPGFGLPASPSRDVCRIECARVALADRMPAARIVPCLGGLSSASLLEFVAATGGTVTLIDRGWCATCPAGRTESPWAEALADVNAVTAATNRSSLTVERNPLPLRRALPLPDHLDARGAARRSVFRRHPEATSGTKPTRAARVRRVEPRQSLRRAAAIARLADRPVSAVLLPGLTVSDRCAANRICVAACPTSALSVGADAQGTGLDLDASRCTACGACASACPEQAITVHERGAGTAAGTITLTRAATVICPECGTRFTPRSGETLCPVCVREHEVARLGFALMRGPATQADTITEHRDHTGIETTPAQGGG